VPIRIFRGVAIIETDIDATGSCRGSHAARGRRCQGRAVDPALIRKLGPFPPPSRMGRAIYTEIWLADKGGVSSSIRRPTADTEPAARGAGPRTSRLAAMRR
jgi:hypothetical protein